MYNLQQKSTKERYVEVVELKLDLELGVDIPDDTAYFYAICVPSLSERPIRTTLDQNDVNVYVENITYDIVE